MIDTASRILHRSAVVAAAICLLPTAVVGQLAKPVDFGHEIRPLLASRCFPCHGPDANKRRGGPGEGDGLRLDNRQGLLADLDGHAAVVPGDPSRSELLRRIKATDRDRMPPRGKGNPLSASQVELIEQWIAEGARVDPLWSHVKPVRPVPPVAVDPAWSSHPIDRFLLARMEQEGLSPSPQASPAVLIRRVTLDLTGLPPTLDEVDRYLSDTSPEAYAGLVDRLLGSPAFGERWARPWLDLARYADSAGYADDPPRTIWGYRDWVIRALNRNQPFDAFTVEQLAGDLLPEPTEDQLVATAFHRNTMTNSEGGTIDEEWRSAAVVDRVNTTMAVWMGTTMGCAQCHTHKFDPITQKEFFAFYAFFNNCEDADRKDERPTLPLFSASQMEQKKDWQLELARLRERVESPDPVIEKSFAAWDETFPRNASWRPLSRRAKKLAGRSRWSAGSSASPVTALRITGDFASSPAVTIALVPEKNEPPQARYLRVELPGKAKLLQLAEVQAFNGGENLARKGKARQISTGYDGRAELAIDGNTDGHYANAKSTTHTAAGDDPWWELDLGSERGIDRVVIWNRTDSIGVGKRLEGFVVRLLDDERRTVWQSPAGKAPRREVELRPDGRRPLNTSAPYRGGGGWTLIVKEPLVIPEGSALELAWAAKTAPPSLIDVSMTLDWRYTKYAQVSPERLAVLDQESKGRGQSPTAALRKYYRSVAPELETARKRIAELTKKMAAMKPSTTVPILRELPEGKARETRIQHRGSYLDTGAKVVAGVPASFHELPAEARGDRLALAHWIVSPDNPLTARVTANRFWEQIFGVGLVETIGDFGVQGDFPSHPDLLDWLACEFQAEGWDVKHLLRTMVMTSAYRQDSRASKAARERDPANRLLSRGPRFRLSAEMIRDQALAVSGLLSRKRFGPPVRPPRPNLGLKAAFGGSTDWKTSSGEDRYRRGIYTNWRRSIPYPSMATFDAPSREVCTLRRIRTNTPLQALVTLNDPVYVEAAQALARRMVAASSNVVDRVKFGFRLCTSRQPSSAERDRLVQLHAQARARYAKEPKQAKIMATVPLGPAPEGADMIDLAAWTVVANVLLNLDEFLARM
ncbi:MAG: DUF1553 domain-containing protein [Planctomycetota bacterium]|nr:DUF1553 domain-containing protein [Planctomycetota bacterium]